MDWEQDALLTELAQGKEFAKQLLANLNPASSKESQILLLQKIISSYGKAFSMLRVSDAPHLIEAKPTTLGSPSSISNNSTRTVDFSSQSHKDSIKKRKTFPRRMEQVKVSSRTSLEGCLDDGYTWRKYGQKGILGASFPRGYYRCTQRYSQGCLATKLVQRSDRDPTVYEVTCKGRHTCIQASRRTIPSSSRNMDNINENEGLLQHRQQGQESPIKSGDTLANHEASWSRVETQDMEIKEDIFAPFSFPSPSNNASENLESCHSFMESLNDINFMGAIPPSFAVSPTTPKSNYYSSPVSPSNGHMEGFGFGFGSGHIDHTPESDLTVAEIISGPASVADSPMKDFSFSLEGFDFDNDNADLFSIFCSSTPTQ